MHSTKIMGILNVTPDSCYDGGRYSACDKAVAHALEMIEEGADIIDIGGESTRPGADPVSEEQELARVIPALDAIRTKTSVPISIDTMKPGVARRAIEAGANILNDVTGFENPEMREIAAGSNADVCIMHMQGNPRTMQANPQYPGGVVEEVKAYLAKQAELLQQCGVSGERIIVDPGICFGKTVTHNLELLQSFESLKSLGFRVLLGISRKSFMMKITELHAREEMLPPTLALSGILMERGADILRVHDVKAHTLSREVITRFTNTKRLAHA